MLLAAGIAMSPLRFVPLLALLALISATAAAQAVPAGHSLSGQVLRDGEPLAGVTILLGAGGGGSLTRTDADGRYSFNHLLDGEYTLTPKMDGLAFTPAQRTIRLQDYSASSLDFGAAAPAAVLPVPALALSASLSPPPAVPLAETPPSAVTAVTATAPATISGRVTVAGTAAAGVTVRYNIVRTPGQTGYVLPQTTTDAEGRYTLPLPPEARPHEAQAWIEAQDGAHLFCPAQAFPDRLAAESGADFADCTPAQVAKGPHRLSGRVTRRGRGVARVAIHQAFAMREGEQYSNAQLGPAVAYTDADGRWQFSAPSISARTVEGGFFAYLAARQADGPLYCPGQIFLAEDLTDATDLDFALCPGQVADTVTDDAPVAAAPEQGQHLDVALTLEGEGGRVPAVAWLQTDGTLTTVWFARWDPQARQWSTPAGVATTSLQEAHGLALASNGRTVAIAYVDETGALGRHVEVVVSEDGGTTWGTLPLGGFAEHSSQPSLAIGAGGDLHLAYYYEGAEKLRRIIYQRRRAGGSFRAVALPMSNHLGSESGWWSLPAVALALDENEVPGVAYFLGGDGDYTQLAFWKPGMGTAAKIAESRQPQQALQLDLVMHGGRAHAAYALDGSAWLASGAYGQDWDVATRLELPAAQPQLALDTATGLRVLAGGGNGQPLALLRTAGNGGPVALGAATKAPQPQRYSLALDGDARTVIALIDAASGAVVLYQPLE